MKIKLLSIILSAVIVVGGGTAAGVAVVNSPENVAIEAITGVFEDLPQRKELAPLVAMAKGGSLEFSASELSSGGVDLLDGGDVKGKLYFDTQEFMLKDFNLSYKDFVISGDIYASSDAFYVKENDIINETIGVKKGELASALENSIFAPDSDSEYAIPQETYDVLIELAKASEDPKNDAMAKDAQKLLERYFEEFYNIFCDAAEFDSESDEVRLNGEKESVRVITITVDGGDVAEIIQHMYDYTRDDKKIIKFLDEYEDVLLPAFEDVLGDEEGRSLSELFEEFLKEGEDDVDSMVNGLESQDDEELVISLVTPKLNSDLLKITFEFENVDLFSIDFGKKGLIKTDKITFETAGTKVVYEIEENSSDKLDASFKVNGEELVSFSINKDKDSYTLKFEDISIKGDISSSFGKTTITIDKIIAYDETVTSDITIVIDESDKMPKPEKDFTTIDEITEEDIEKWVTDITEAVMKVEENVF